MMRLLLFSLAAGLSLGSASPPDPLSYDLTSVWEPGGSQERRAWIPSVPLDEALELAMMNVTPTFSEAPPPAPPAAVVEPAAAAPAPETSAAPSAAAPAPVPAGDGVRVVVSIPQQKAYVFEGGELVATSPVSTGKRGHETPVGTFRILQKKVRHHSNLYSNAPMPYMQRLTHGGIAIHAGELPGYPASHGCIRLPWSFAKKLYGMTSFATRVTITKESPESPEEALALI